MRRIGPGRPAHWKDISIAYFWVLIVGFGLWVGYGISRHDVPLVVPNSVAMLVMAVTIAVARRHRP